MPTGAKKASVVWSLPERQAEDPTGKDQNSFLEALNTAFGNHLELGLLQVAEMAINSYCPHQYAGVHFSR